MKLTGSNRLWQASRGGVRKLAASVLVAWMLCVACLSRASAEVGTTTVQGTVYLEDGWPGSGMVHVSWPAFTTASRQAVVADSVDVTKGDEGFLGSVKNFV